VLTQKPGRYILRDNEKVEVIADSLLQPVFCLRAGVRHDAVAPILPQAVAA
jgi:dihydroorotase